MYILASDFLEKDNKYISKARNSCVDTFQPLNTYIYISFLFRNKSDNLFLYIRNHENSRLQPVFGTQYPFVYVWAGREYLMDIEQSKNRCKM